MERKLTVILGAGASSSLKQSNSRIMQSPLTSEIFGPRFDRILHKYSLAELLGTEINKSIRQNKEGIGLEQILKDYVDRLDQEPLLRKRFLQIPLYLRDVFSTVVQSFHSSIPEEYSNLVQRVVDSKIEVLFLTLNYDTLLEIPLARLFDTNFEREDDYINDKWSLVKLHGSINWAKKFRSITHADPSDEEHLNLLKTVAWPLELEDKFFISSIRNYNLKYVERTPVYPALTVPVAGKYDINCPKPHLVKLRSFLKESKNYLIIGTSGNDQDLLEILKENAGGGKTLVVGRDEKRTNSVRERFILNVPQFTNTSTFYHERGFSEFIDSKLDDYLTNLI